MKMKSVSDQVVVIVGASSGIGRETALRFAGRGAKVVAAARSLPELGLLVDEIQEHGGQATAVPVDVSEFEQVKALADRAVEVYGRIDTWVHLAAVSMYATFMETRPEEFRRIIDVNLLGQAYGAMAALPHLLPAGGGTLIHVSSVEARRALPLQSAYTASKHGMLGFLDALRMEVQQEKLPIQVTNIMPASINTPFFDKALTRLGVKPQPLPPVYEPEVVAEAIVYAAEHPVREMVVGGAGKMIGLMQRISPAFAEKVLGKVSYVGQRTDEPKRADAPNNLFWHVPGYDTAKGSFSDQARSNSLYTWLQTHPAAKYALTASVLSAAALVSARSFRVRRGWISHLSERLNKITSSIAGRINRERA